MKKIQLGILISGRGSNMQAIIRNSLQPNYPAEVAVVISDREDAKGLELAEQAGIQIFLVDYKEHKNKKTFESQLSEILKLYGVDLVCLAGFMRILSEDFISRWRNQIINIHPSLLPEFKGLDTHRRVLERGDGKHGCTVHWVNENLDDGEIILQSVLEVRPDDTEESLNLRVLEQEHLLYPTAISLICKKLLRNY